MTNATTTTIAATTIKNSNRILYRVVNQIAQKFGLNSEAKKQLTDFVAQRVKGEIKTMFPFELPDDERFEYATFSLGDKVILLAYGDNPNKDKYSNIIYACIRDIPEKEDELKSKEDEFKSNNIVNSLFSVDRDKIIVGTVKRVKSHLNSYMSINIDDWVETQIYDFLNSNTVNGRVGVLFTHELPDSESYSRTEIHIGDYNLNLVYGVNPVRNNYTNVMWVNVTKTAEAQQREFMELREAKFRRFWANEQLPEALLYEVIQKVDLKNPITIAVYASAGEWNKYRKNEKGNITFIGQQPDPKTGNFVPNRPIGYVTENHLVITSPGSSIKLMCHDFN